MVAKSIDSGDAPWYEGHRVRDAIRKNLWLHFTQMVQYRDAERRPLVLVRGEGSTVWDDQGNFYLDLIAGILARRFDELGRRLGTVGTAYPVSSNGSEPVA